MQVLLLYTASLYFSAGFPFACSPGYPVTPPKASALGAEGRLGSVLPSKNSLDTKFCIDR